jgi:hypothetical protein
MEFTRLVLYPQLFEDSVCLGLFLAANGFYNHGGQTGGFTTYLGFNEVLQRGVVVLSNTTFLYVPQLAQVVATLAPGGALDAVVPPTLSVAPADLDSYVGTYELPSNFVITVSRQGDRLFAQGSGQAALRLYATAKDIFYFRAVYAQLVFNRDDSDSVVSVTLDQNGVQQVGPRI